MRAMKDSGIAWIGEIPIDWETRKIKYIATLNGRIGWQGLTSSEYCDDGAYLIRRTPSSPATSLAQRPGAPSARRIKQIRTLSCYRHVLINVRLNVLIIYVAPLW